MSQNTNMTEFTKSFRLAFLISGLLDGGIETVLIEYLKHLATDKRLKITLCIAKAMGDLEVFKHNIPQEIKVVYGSKTPILSRFAQLRATRKASRWEKLFDELCLNIVRKYQIKKSIQQVTAGADVVIDFDSCAYSSLRNCKAKKIAFFHFSFKQRLMQNKRQMERIAKKLSQYDKVVTICEAMQAEAHQYFTYLKDKLEVLYNPKIQSDALRKAEELPNDERIKQPFLLQVGRLDETSKDVTTLLKAYAILVKKYQHTERLYLIGKGKSESALRQLAKELEIEDKVVFLGFTPNPYPWIKHCKALVHSAKFEGLPTVLVEGLMLNKLIVATDCPIGPGEVLDRGKAGLLVPVGDAEALAANIHQLLNDDELQKKLLKGAEQRAIDFTFKAIAPKLYSIMGIA